MITKGDVKLIYGEGGIRILWKEFELTKLPGLSCGINTLGFWTDSSKADWHFIEKEADYVKIKIFFKELPISQVWLLKIDQEQRVQWSIDVELTEHIHIDEFHIVSMLNPIYKTWVNGYVQNDFPCLDKHWHDLYISETPVELVAVRFPLISDSLPCFILEVLDCKEDFSAIVQKAPLDFPAYLIGFKKLISSNKKRHSVGINHLFSGRITLSKGEDFLDSQIEILRQKDLRYLSQQKQIDNIQPEEKLNSINSVDRKFFQ